jgi:hypothetical protein
MKEVWKEQYEKKSTPWNYDRFDKDIQSFLEIIKYFLFGITHY